MPGGVSAGSSDQSGSALKMLPRISGTDFLEKFRATPQGKNIPVVALTNLAEEEEKQRAIKLGVKEYLVKAMQTPEQVVEKVKKYISS